MKVTSTWGGLEGELSASPGLWAIEVDGVPICGIDFAYCGIGDDEQDVEGGGHKIIIGYWDLSLDGDDDWRRLHEIPMFHLRNMINQQNAAERDHKAWSIVRELADLGPDRDKFELIHRARELLGRESS